MELAHQLKTTVQISIFSASTSL